MKNNFQSLENKIFSQDPLTGTFRYNGSHRQFSVNKAAFITFLKRQAADLRLTQSRICFHSGDDSILQVMLVYHSTRHNVKRHVHLDKDEYIYIVEGRLTIRIYGENGEVIDTMLLSSSAHSDGHDLFCFLPKGVVHDAIIHDDSLFIETTTGPFHKSSTAYISASNLD
jgi:cupin fold WbuC family metalloprotein